MFLGIFVYFGLYLSQLAFIWKIDGIHKFLGKKMLTIRPIILKYILIHYTKEYNINKERKQFPKNKLYSNSIGLVSLSMQIFAHIMYTLFVIIRIQVFQANDRLFIILQIIVFSLSIAYTIGLMIYQGVYEDRIMKKNNAK